MLKKKVQVKSKKGPVEPLSRVRTDPERTEPETKSRMPLIPLAPSMPSIPSSRVYTLGGSSTKYLGLPNNMVKLNITLNDVNRLETTLNHRGLLHGIETPVPVPVPVPWNDNFASVIDAESKSETKSNPFVTLIKKPEIIDCPSTPSVTPSSRKDLIINSGVKRSSKPIMQIYTHGWPAHSSYACWYCCHTFNTTPVGIPQLLVNMVFHCYGNFCSYNCAKRYLRPDNEDDIAMMQTSNDNIIQDDLGERLQLLELMCHIETGSPLDESIKMAPRRLSLSMFGGTKSIEEFRKSFLTNDSYHVFRFPLVPISYQLEECTDKTERKRKTRVSLDTIKIERAFSELAEKVKQSKTGLQKRLTTS